MKPVITPEESSRLDAESAVPVATLMERAGMGVALHASRLGAGYGRRVAILAGTIAHCKNQHTADDRKPD